MREAVSKERQIVVDILSKSFDKNCSVNYLIPQNKSRERRLRRLMEYSFDYCTLFGKVLLTKDLNACALVVIPERERMTLKSLILSVRLMFRTIGIGNLGKAIRREAAIKKLHEGPSRRYLWFIGVSPESQGRGVGTDLLKEIIADADVTNAPLYLETSVERNLSFYSKLGFTKYAELDFGYRLFCMKRDI